MGCQPVFFLRKQKKHLIDLLKNLLKRTTNMRMNVKAKPNAREEKVEKIDDLNYIVSVKEPPIKGKANEAIRNALAVYFKTSSSRVKIVSGFGSRNKIIEIVN